MVTITGTLKEIEAIKTAIEFFGAYNEAYICKEIACENCPFDCRYNTINADLVITNVKGGRL